MLEKETQYSITLVVFAVLSIVLMIYALGDGFSMDPLSTPTGAVVYDQKAPQSDDVRVLITPKNHDADGKLREDPRLDIKHEFVSKFTATVKRKDIQRLAVLADITEVPLYTLQLMEVSGPKGRGVCGDLLCQGTEPTTCPSDCGTTPFTRQCYPTNQKAFNVIQVNGGSPSNGKGVKVAILDTGVQNEHPDLKASIALCADTTKRGIVKTCEDLSAVGHGTHVAGIIGANGGPDLRGELGVAPSSSLLIIKVCQDNGNCYADDVAEGISYAAKKGANIISMSFGGPTESQMIRDAVSKYPNILYIAAAGNTGPAADTINYPGASASVVAVAANDIDGVVSSFSSRGLTEGNDAIVSAREVELSAGGVAVESTNTDGCYSALSGTSFSTPTVAGVAATAWDLADGKIDGKGNAASTREYLKTIANDITIANGGGAGTGYDIASGYGLPIIK